MIIEVLFPEVANLYGDLGNIEYIKRSVEESGLTCEVINTDLYSKPYFADHDDVDLIYTGPVTEKGQIRVIESLMPYKDRIKELIEGGQRFLITGNAFEVFGDFIEMEQGGPHEKCLGIFPYYTIQRMMKRTSSFWVGSFIDGGDDIVTVGYKSQFTHAYFETEDSGSVLPRPDFLLVTERGEGLNPDVKDEGVRYKNFMGTYLLGPILVLNPLLTQKLLNDLGAEGAKPLFEKAALEAYNFRVAEYKDTSRNYMY